MKEYFCKSFIAGFSLLLMGCASIQIPPAPQWKNVEFHHMGKGVICMDSENTRTLMEDIVALRKHQDDLLLLLEKCK